MEAYATALTYAIPGFLVLIIIEYIASRFMKKDVMNSMDTISSLSSGMTNTLKDVLGLSIVIISYDWMVEHMALYTISEKWLTYIVCFVLVDFASYWSHRWNHEINVMWNRHIVHHSSEEFNLACALRQSISGLIGVYFFLMIPMALVGVPPKVLAIVAPIHLFAQFWYHTRLIDRMGFLEKIIVTPSHHRVHHAINKEYIDKNFAAIFIIWDKMFGTFQEEIDGIPAVYGVKRQVKTWNPILINWQHMWLLAKDSWRTKSLWNKIRLWFMPTGWRPNDVKEKYKIDIVGNPYEMIKYEKPYSRLLKAWAWIQLIFNSLLLYHLLTQIATLDYMQIILYATFIFISIFAYTSLMDRQKISVPVEMIKFGLGLFVVFSIGHWFNIDQIMPTGSALVIFYIGLSLTMSIYFTYFENEKFTQLSSTA